MSDFTSGFWSFYVIALTAASFVFCIWILLAMSKARAGAGDKKASEGGKGAQTTGHVWDGDLTELNNPLPKWWANLFW